MPIIEAARAHAHEGPLVALLGLGIVVIVIWAFIKDQR